MPASGSPKTQTWNHLVPWRRHVIARKTIHLASLSGSGERLLEDMTFHSLLMSSLIALPGMLTHPGLPLISLAWANCGLPSIVRARR